MEGGRNGGRKEGREEEEERERERVGGSQTYFKLFPYPTMVMADVLSCAGIDVNSTLSKCTMIIMRWSSSWGCGKKVT